MEAQEISTRLLESLELTTAEFEEPAPPSEAPEKLTRKQLGQLRRQYMTITHGTVRACGHLARFSKDHDPKNNCISCWGAYFSTSVDLDLIHAVLTTKGVKALVAMKGTRFTKMFHGFLASQLLPALAAEIDKELPAQIVGGTFGANQSSEVPTIGTTE
jgi:hypothetical protein